MFKLDAPIPSGAPTDVRTRVFEWPSDSYPGPTNQQIGFRVACGSAPDMACTGTLIVTMWMLLDVWIAYLVKGMATTIRVIRPDRPSGGGDESSESELGPVSGQNSCLRQDGITGETLGRRSPTVYCIAPDNNWTWHYARGMMIFDSDNIGTAEQADGSLTPATPLAIVRDQNFPTTDGSSRK